MKKAKATLTVIASVYLAVFAPAGFASWLQLLDVPEHARPYIAAPVALLMGVVILELLTGYIAAQRSAA